MTLVAIVGGRLHRSDQHGSGRHSGVQVAGRAGRLYREAGKRHAGSAKRFEFEKAAKLRDAIKELRTKEFLFA